VTDECVLTIGGENVD